RGAGRSSLSRVAELPRGQGCSHPLRNTGRPPADCGGHLCAALDPPSADDPNLVRRGNRRSHQRADHRLRASILLLSNAARLRVARAVEAPRKHPSPDPRSRATNRIQDLSDRIRLVRSPGIGPVTYRQLLARFGTPAAALAAVPDLARRGGGAAPRLCSRDEAEREIAAVEKLGARYIVMGQGLYPRLLAELEDAPPLL